MRQMLVKKINRVFKLVEMITANKNITQRKINQALEFDSLKLEISREFGSETWTDICSSLKLEPSVDGSDLLS